MDDRIFQISLISKVCTRCKHFDELSVFGKKKTCKAFPNEIPEEIWLGENDHKNPHEGDNGIQFELHPDAKQ